MRISAWALAFLLFSVASSAGADKWIVKSEAAFGCTSAQKIQQLRLMSALPAAFEIAFAQEIDSGNCGKLTPGEVVEELARTSPQGDPLIHARRSNGETLYIEVSYLARSI